MTDKIAFSVDTTYNYYKDVPLELKLNWFLGRGNTNVQAVKEPNGIHIFFMPPPNCKFPYAEEYIDFIHEYNSFHNDFIFLKQIGLGDVFGDVTGTTQYKSLPSYRSIIHGTIPPHTEPYCISFIINLHYQPNRIELEEFTKQVSPDNNNAYGEIFSLYLLNEFNDFEYYGFNPSFPPDNRFPSYYYELDDVDVLFNVQGHYYGYVFFEISPNKESEFIVLPGVSPFSAVVSKYNSITKKYEITNELDNLFHEFLMERDAIIETIEYKVVINESPTGWSGRKETITIVYDSGNEDGSSLLDVIGTDNYGVYINEKNVISRITYKKDPIKWTPLYTDRNNSDYMKITWFNIHLLSGSSVGSSVMGIRKNNYLEHLTNNNLTDNGRITPTTLGLLKLDGTIEGDFLKNTLLISAHIERLEKEINLFDILYDSLDAFVNFDVLMNGLNYNPDTFQFTIPFNTSKYAEIIAELMEDEVDSDQQSVLINYYYDTIVNYNVSRLIPFQTYASSYISKTLMYKLLREIHACLGAGEFSYYEDSNGDLQPYKMNVARLLQRFARAYGVSFRADGTVLPIRRRASKEYNVQDVVTIPDGWARGQFVDNTDESTDGQPSTGTDKDKNEERMGIAYQNRCNKYIKFDDENPINNEYRRGDVVLCENFLQLFESYLEDIDKGLNWQEMGTGILPSADRNGYCTYEGMGTLLAEVTYMISQLSSNIYQTHNLSLQSVATGREILKALGLPLDIGSIEIATGEPDSLGLGDSINAYLPLLRLADDSPTIHRRLMDILINLSLIVGASMKLNDSSAPTVPPIP